MKCVDCGKEFEQVPIEKHLKVTTTNPGTVNLKGVVFECPECKQTYADSGQMRKLAQAFDQAYPSNH